MPKVISERAFKMSFLQTVPGQEFAVAEQIRAKCRSNNLVDFAILKGFGCYDIIFFYSSEKGYDSILTKTGPIRGIVRTSRLFCFQYIINDSNDNKFFKTINSSTYTSISLIKLNPKLDKPVEEVKGVIDRCVFDKKANIKSGWAFGTLGWVDLAIIKSGESPTQLLQDVLWASCDQIPSIYKTYSYIAINHDKLPKKESVLLDETKIKSYLSKNKTFNDAIPKGILPKISISFDPYQANLVYNFWAGRNYNVVATIGKDDVLVTPPTESTFSDFLSNLLYFRANYRNSFQTTETKLDIAFDKTDFLEGPPRESLSNTFIDYNYDDLESIFNESAAHNLSANINSLNGLLQHRIISDAFLDLREYVEFVKESGRLIQKSQFTEDRISFAIKCSALIKSGAELRLYGTHGTIEESVGQFTKLRGGVQKSLQAMEYFPSSIISRVTDDQFSWSGFVITGAKEFLNLNEVLIVPYESLWKPLDWWPLYHEVAHIMINNLKNLLDPELPEIQMFLAKKSFTKSWTYLLNEISAEIIGYEFGFFGDFDLYMDLVWKYLRELSPECDNISSISTYLIRTFFVDLYDKLFIKNEITPDDLNDLDIMYTSLLNHIKRVKSNYYDSCMRNEIFDEMYFLAAQHASLPKELFPWMKNRLLTTSRSLNFRGSNDLLDSENTKSVVKCISDGKRWDAPVISPEAVLYNFMKSGRMTFEQSMSFILTFWNLHHFK